MHERWFSFIVFGLAIILGISRLISTFWRYSPFEYATQLKLNNNSISFLGNNLPLAKISKITIELRDKEIQPLRSENNYLEIKTSEGDTFELAVLIDNPSDVMAVQKLVTELKSKVSTVVFENYLV